ncbi:uncharacterized protein [Leptinotarsa decemlineata]|uniref:uncharacterized protein n=1 Tax=Leptinotarsa decemlineata TaxID=7539 RepID=UPI003D30ABEF
MSPTRSIKREVAGTEEQDDRIISSAFNVEQVSIEDQEQNSCAVMLSVTEEEPYGYFSPCASSSFNIKQESFGDQEQNSCNVIPTTGEKSCVFPEKRNDNIILPTSSIDSKFTRADRDLGRELGVCLTGHQLMELEQEFSLELFPSRMRRVEISRKLQLSEKQVTIWFQNRRLILRKYGEPIPRIVLSPGKQSNTREILNEIPQKQEYGCISPTRSIKREVAETEKQDDRIISSAFKVELESIEGQEQNSCAVMPTTSKDSCEAQNERNDNSNLPTSSIETTIAGAEEQNKLDVNNLVANRDRQRLRVTFTKHQLMVLEQEFSVQRFPSKMKRVEISDKLQLSEKQVKFWFQNRRIKSKKNL